MHTKGGREGGRERERRHTGWLTNHSFHHISMYLSNYFLLKLTRAVVISRGDMGLLGPLTCKGIITFGYICGEESESRRGALFILITGLMQLFPYISAFSTPGHSTPP